MKPNVFKIIKLVVPMASVAVTLAANYLDKKELDEKVTKMVAEAVSKSNGEGA